MVDLEKIKKPEKASGEISLIKCNTDRPTYILHKIASQNLGIASRNCTALLMFYS